MRPIDPRAAAESRRAGLLHARGGVRRGRDGENGQVVVIFAIVLVAILAFTAMVIDLGMLRNDRQILVNAMDSGALAGGSMLPVNGAAEATVVTNVIDKTVLADYPGIGSYSILYRCLIGVTGGLPAIARDVPLVCDPTHALGHSPVASDFTGAGSTRVALCRPDLGDKCNAVLVTGFATQGYTFGRVVGVDSGSTGAVQSAACRGPCGAPPTVPVDVVLIMDRTQSMNGADTTNAKAAANSIVSLYNPGQQWLGLGTLGPSQATACVTTPAGAIGTANAPTDLRRWVPVGLSGVGATNATYAQLTAAISCYPNSSTGTDLADPVTMAAYELTRNGRPGAAKGIILETDGQPNAGVAAGPNYCALASAAAAAAKAQSIELYTIGFGLDAASGGDPACPDTSGTFKGKTATALLSDMSTGPSAGTTSCAATENTDGDHFFCQPKSGDLTSIFQIVAAALVNGPAHLVQLYPTPVVTAVSPSTGTYKGGTSVTITGAFFTGATSVKFGGVAVSFTVNSDTSITATAPIGTKGATVHIIVTTPGGVTAPVSADRYTFN